MAASLTERMSLYSVDDPSGCRLWKGTIDAKGYGRLFWQGKSRIASRLAFQLWCGRTLAPTEHVCHHCDTPACVLPAHLFVGTHADNMRDMAAKGRASRLYGADNSMARFTRDQVVSILLDGRPNVELAAVYGVHRTTIADIRRGLYWRSVWLEVTRPQPGSDQARNVPKSLKALRVGDLLHAQHGGGIDVREVRQVVEGLRNGNE